MEGQKKLTSCQLDVEVKERLKRYVSATGGKQGFVIQSAIVEYLDKRKAK